MLADGTAVCSLAFVWAVAVAACPITVSASSAPTKCLSLIDLPPLHLPSRRAAPACFDCWRIGCAFIPRNAASHFSGRGATGPRRQGVLPAPARRQTWDAL